MSRDTSVVGLLIVHLQCHYFASGKSWIFFVPRVQWEEQERVNQEAQMITHKSVKELSIHTIQYDQLVVHQTYQLPHIRNLIDWLDWDWSNDYLAPEKAMPSRHRKFCDKSAVTDQR